MPTVLMGLPVTLNACGDLPLRVKCSNAYQTSAMQSASITSFVTADLQLRLLIEQVNATVHGMPPRVFLQSVQFGTLQPKGCL